LVQGPSHSLDQLLKKTELAPIIAELQANYSGTQQGLNDGKYRSRSEQHNDSFIYKRQINGATKWLIYPHECYSSTNPKDVAADKGVAAQTSPVSNRFPVDGANYN
jgi:hypothetical protein